MAKRGAGAAAPGGRKKAAKPGAAAPGGREMAVGGDEDGRGLGGVLACSPGWGIGEGSAAP